MSGGRGERGEGLVGVDMRGGVVGDDVVGEIVWDGVGT